MTSPLVAAPAQPAPASAPRHRRSFCLALAALALALGLHLATAPKGLTWDAEGKEEVLNTLTVRALAETGPALAYDTPVLGYPWKIPTDLGVQSNAAALLVRATGWSAERAGRSVSLFFFYLTLPGVYLIARGLGGTRAAALFALALWLIGPWSRSQAASLSGTTTALALAVAWLGLWLRCLQEPTLRYRLGTALAGALAAPAGWAVFLPIAIAGLLLGLRSALQHRQPRNVVATNWIVAYLPALVCLAGWIAYTDALKSANVYAGFLSSAERWKDALGPVSGRFTVDFVMGTFVPLAGMLASATLCLLLAVFAGVLSRNSRQVALALAATVALVLFLFPPFYQANPAGLLAPAFLIALVLGLFLDDLLRSPFLSFVPALLILALAIGTQYRRPQTVESAPAAPVLHDTALAQAVRAATDPTDVVVTLGQGWTPQFAYDVQRRAILVPARRETELAALDRALGPGNDRIVGAVVVTGRYRSETAYLEQLGNRFNLAAEPRLQSPASDVYVPEDRHESVLERLADSPHAGLLAQPSPPPAPPEPEPSPATETPDAPPPDDPFAMISPRPDRFEIAYGASVHGVDGEYCLFAHAPSLLEFDLTPGDRRLIFDYFMAEGAYTGTGDTDGVEIVVTLIPPGEEPQGLHHQELDPINTPADRLPQSVQLEFQTEPGAVLRIEVGPGEEGRANFDWVYVRRLEID